MKFIWAEKRRKTALPPPKNTNNSLTPPLAINKNNMELKKKFGQIIFLLTITVFVSFFSFFFVPKIYKIYKARKYDAAHEKYRTLWYRTNEKCFYDSSKKYGELYRKAMGWDEIDFSIDTIPYTGNDTCH